jgi:cysteine desulfurase
LPNTTCFAVRGIDGETLVGKLDRAGYAVASGAACSAANPEPSHVLMAMGVVPELARGAVRVSLGRQTTADEMNGFLATLRITLAELKNLSAVTAIH